MTSGLNLPKSMECGLLECYEANKACGAMRYWSEFQTLDTRWVGECLLSAIEDGQNSGSEKGLGWQKLSRCWGKFPGFVAV